MLELENVCKKYKEKQALNGICLTLTEGIYGLLGPNGAGKSTLMNIITGNIEPSSGTRTLYDEYGQPHVCVDEYMKRRLEIKLISSIVTIP